jgi:RHS repeat-associated protein
VIPLWNQRGQAPYVTFANGTRQLCPGFADGRCLGTRWLLAWDAYGARKNGAVLSSDGGSTVWLGAIMEDQQDASGLLYRRNRYYDPSTGRFTQEDPIGLAGGLNLYGFANGDPISYSDPYGLCPEEDQACEQLVRDLRAQKGSAFQRAADVYDRADYSVNVVGGDHFALNRDGSNTDGIPNTWTGGTTLHNYKTVVLNGDFSREDQLVIAVHESVHVANPGSPDERPAWRATADAFMQLSPAAQARAPHGAYIAHLRFGGPHGSRNTNFFEWRATCYRSSARFCQGQ